ncbi:uncharacterized protein G2W53_031612 [Senna tora]|uniref:Uncharacterized protein n=1 Tax=Senna tora TaxID=362788 RepID=A0A834T8I7_9FABA|nr:uncharacterized protein G2W53_031612 [Senna tora]
MVAGGGRRAKKCVLLILVKEKINLAARYLSVSPAMVYRRLKLKPNPVPIVDTCQIPSLRTAWKVKVSKDCSVLCNLQAE